MSENIVDTITNAITAIDESFSKYEDAMKRVKEQDNKLQSYLHRIEHTGNAIELMSLALELHESRNLRRKAKDEALLYEPVIRFRNSSRSMSELKALCNDLKSKEAYVKIGKNRVYSNDVLDDKNQAYDENCCCSEVISLALKDMLSTLKEKRQEGLA